MAGCFESSLLPGSFMSGSGGWLVALTLVVWLFALSLVGRLVTLSLVGWLVTLSLVG